MDFNTESVLLQDHLIGPAFLVADGMITQVNDAAAKQGLTAGVPVTQFIAVGADAYKKYRSGKLFLQLNIGGVIVDATVTKLNTEHLFCLRSAYRMPELRAFALAAQQLRSPLSSAILNAELLHSSSSLQDDPQAKAQLSQLTCGLFQLFRAVSNMADASGSPFQLQSPESCNAAVVFEEWMQKIAAALAQADRTLVFQGLKRPVQCYLNTGLLERAVLNLVSNAVKFSPQSSTIRTSLRAQGNQLVFTIENDGISGGSLSLQNAFNHFLREPGIDGHQYGIGLGMSIVLCAAATHRGTVLLNKCKKAGVKVVFTISTDRQPPALLESPLHFIGGYTGGFDPVLVELSDVLPDSSYE